jgi:hypothetical protein
MGTPTSLRGSSTGSPSFFFAGFAPVWLTVILVVLPTAVLTVMDLIAPYSFVLLFDAQMTPWGIFTSLFVPANVAANVLPNVGFLLVYSLLFVATNQGCSEHERAARARVYAAIVVASAIAANVLWLVATPLESFGASVIVFGSAGTSVGFALYNMFPSERSDKDSWNQYFNGGGWIFGLSNEFVFLGSFLLLTVSPTSLLGSMDSVNAFSHGIAFLVSFLASVAFLLSRDFGARRSHRSRNSSAGEARLSGPSQHSVDADGVFRESSEAENPAASESGQGSKGESEP